MHHYLELLRDAGIKATPQRLAILKYLDTHHTHPTVDEIYSALRASYPTLSKTTVYNTLETLKSHGMVEMLTIEPHETRYDLDTSPHHHFLCKSCGRIIDIAVECPYLDEIIAGEHKIDEVHGYFKGICNDCLARGERRNDQERTSDV